MSRPAGVLDEAIHHLDSTTEPWGIHVELHLGAALDEVRLREAVNRALHRHPRARACLVETRGWPRRYEWQVPMTRDLEPLDVVEAGTDEALAEARHDFVSRPIPLAAAPPLRLRLVRRPDGDVIMLNLHHAAGDGIAALVFLQSVARAYASRPEVLASATARVPTGSTLGTGMRPRAVLTELVQAARRSTRLAAEGGHEAPGYRCHLLSLGAGRTEALVECAGDGVTVNDILLAALHLAVDTWNRDHGAPAGRIAVLMPVNLRARSGWRDGFDNLTFPVPVSTAGPDRVDTATVVRTVARRTRRAKDQRSAATVVGALERLQVLPIRARRWIAQQAAHPKLRPTILLSNLGPLEHDFDFGPGVGGPRQVWFSPPARMPLGVAIGALTAGGELRLAFRVRHPSLGPEAAARFAAIYRSRLEGTILDRLPDRSPVSSARAA